MSQPDSSQRSRGPPNGNPSGLNIRPALENRNGGSHTTGPSMTRAEKFEDEKRRIIESCFGKKEADGSISESYITHIRILEDAAYPSTPPPAESPPENKKPRVIVVAVRKSGRVRMHKARENTNGSFSIGKTWVLDDLTAIQSFTKTTPVTVEEQQGKERAGGVGFIITIQKPYYWQASTPKEKDFFIYSLIKIFKKYTGGKLPELHGFDQQELEQLAGVGSGPGTPQARTPQTPSARGENGATYQGPPTFQGGRPLNTSQPERIRQNGRETRPHVSQERSSRERPPQSRPPQERIPQPRPSQERIFRTTDSTDSIPHIPGSFPTSDFIRNIRPQDSQSQLNYKGVESSTVLMGHRDGSIPPGVQQELIPPRLAGSQSSESFRNRQEYQSKGVPGGGRPSGERIRQNGHYANVDTSGSSTGRPSSSDRNQLPTPLRSGVPDSWQSSQVPRGERRPSDTSHRPSSSHHNSEKENSQERSARPTAPDFQTDHSRNNSSLGSRQNRGVEPNPSEAGNGVDILTSVPKTTKGHQNTLVVKNEKSISSTKTNGATFGSEGKPSSIPTEPQPKLSPEVSSEVLPEVPPEVPPEVHHEVSQEVPSEVPPEVQSHRPGLGPMIKTKSNQDVANKFRKAATTYNAFKPRVGGAVEKLRDGQDQSTNENDGVSGVFPSPSIVKAINQDTVKCMALDQTLGVDSSPKPENIPPVVSTVISPPSIEIASPQKEEQNSPSAEKIPDLRKKPHEERPRKRRSNHSAKYAKVLGINHGLLEGRSFEIETILDKFGGSGKSNQKNTFEEVQSGLRKEIARVEAGSLLGALEAGDERVTAVGQMMDKVIAECEELDCLLTLYNVELGTLSEDVAYIEAQSQGLQVQTANQKLLHTELKTLLDTISISASDLRVLKDASLSRSQGLQAIEKTLSQLYTAMLTIDPKSRQNGSHPTTSDQISVDRSSVNGFGGSELSSMRAVREKKDGYRKESVDFIQRLKHHMSIKFREVEAQSMDALRLHSTNSKSRDLTRLDFRLRERPKEDLWLYSPLLLYTRQMEPLEWENLLRAYENSAKKPYQDEFTDHVFAWKSITRKPFDCDEVLFTTQEKDSESIVARKLTVKRAKTVRSDGSSRISTSDKPHDGKVNAYEAFAGALSEMARMILVEQNFIVDLFHLNSLEDSDFIDAISTAPEARKGGNPIQKKTFDPDRNMAKRVSGTMEEIYSFWPAELQNLADWVVKQEPLQGLGVLLSLEAQLAELEETNQDFLTQSIAKVHDRLAILFSHLVEEQIRGIEDTKVKIKKRKGVISFIKIFPNFSAAIENMLPPLRNLENPPVRALVNDAYHKLNKAMFESLKFIAKESPIAISQGQPSGDPEDKEALNYHILLIENMNHYVEEVHPKSNPVLVDWKDRAQREMAEHMELYLSAVTRRPLGKLLDFLESTESLLLHATDGAPSIATRVSHSRSAFKKLLASYDAKEIRRGVETLKKRVEKHFGDADEAELSRALVARVLRECERVYIQVGERVARVITEVYESSAEIEWRREDLVAAFRR